MKMKDSGVAWIGKIPAGWEVRNLTHCCCFFKGLAITKADLAETGTAVISYGQIHSKLNVGTHLKPELLRFVPEAIASAASGSRLNVGDIVFADTSEDVEGCGNCVLMDAEVPVYAGYHTIVARPNEPGRSRYFSYLFNAPCWRSQVRSKVAGIKVFSVTQRIFKGVSVLLPSASDANAIVAYLDKKTAAIDSRVAVLEQKLAAYKRLKASVTNRAVTRGVPGWGRGNGTTETTGTNGTVATSQGLSNGGAAKGVKVGARRVPEVAEVSGVPCRGSLIDRPLRDSGVDWIGKVPAGWSVDKIGNCFDVIGSGTTPRTGSQDLYEGEIPWVQSGDLHGDWVFETSKRVNETALMNYSLPIYKAPFICVAMYGASIGNVSKIGIDACTNQACCALCKPRPEICLGFMFYLLRQSQQRLLLFAEGGTQPNINRGTITGLRVGLPPLSEQRAIADYLDAECAKIDKMAELVTREIELYKKLKRSLINEVVTGKRGVA